MFLGGRLNLGATLINDGLRKGCLFRLLAPKAELVELVLNRNQRLTSYQMELGADQVWQVFVPGVQAQQLYGYRCHGVWDPASGQRFNSAKLLTDPYARAITSGVDFLGPVNGHLGDSLQVIDDRDSARFVPWSVVVGDTGEVTKLANRRPLTESLIYELHVKGFTRCHPDVPEHLRGTYAGLAYPSVLNYLVNLGVTAVELLPVHHFVSEPFVIRKGKTNYWGYNTLGFFAPHGPYSSSGSFGGQVSEFKKMVSAFHEAGIEVILDVVYNHTCEGGKDGPSLCWRGIDNQNYYRLGADPLINYDVTGCGNSLNTANPQVLEMVLDSLRYWVSEMGVDGFRFDLASALIRDEKHQVTQNHPFKEAIANDPTFESIKMIAEPWDVGPFGYQVGHWGERWSEWNDRYRDYLRDYWRGSTFGVKELATRLAGSPDLFSYPGADLANSINFITCHDGFTMRDLVSYNSKHNEENGEENRDGTNENHSWNCGWEGETTDPNISRLRQRQVKNMMASLLLSAGVPMLLAGDELGRSQLGNNNAYCQDSPISWLDWAEENQWPDVTDFVKKLIRLRRDHSVFRPSEYRHGEEVVDLAGEPLGRPDVAWLSGTEAPMDQGDWDNGARRHLGMYLSNDEEAFIIWFNSSPEPVEVLMPRMPWGTGYEVVLHTATDAEMGETTYLSGELLKLPARSVVVLEAVIPTSAEERVALEKAEADFLKTIAESTNS